MPISNVLNISIKLENSRYAGRSKAYSVIQTDGVEAYNADSVGSQSDKRKDILQIMQGARHTMALYAAFDWFAA